MYKKPEWYVREIAEGERGYGRWKYRVVGRDGIHDTHHTNDFDDAVHWSERCIKYWLEQDALAQ